MDWVILGCGYTGTRLARRLVRQGENVVGTRRTREGVAELEGTGIGGIRFDIDTLGSAHIFGRTPGESLTWIPAGALVVHSAPPSPRTPEVEPLLVAALAARSIRRLVYVSSTGVYPPAGGGWVDEDTPPSPEGDAGRRRWAAESALAEASAGLGVSFVALRAAGIYGPGRGVHARMRNGTYRIVGDGSTWVSRIHVDDLGSAIRAAALTPALGRRTYNVADDGPTSAAEHADAVAAMLGLPPPPRVPADAVSADVRAMLLANRRISNRRIKEELGVRWAYPTWREGTEASLAEERSAAE